MYNRDGRRAADDSLREPKIVKGDGRVNLSVTAIVRGHQISQ